MFSQRMVRYSADFHYRFISMLLYAFRSPAVSPIRFMRPKEHLSLCPYHFR
jgi:hypothetical protein